MKSETFQDRLAMVIGKKANRVIGEIIGVSEGTVRSYLRGNSTPQIGKLIKLAEYAKVRVEWLAEGVGPMMRDQESPSQVSEPGAAWNTSDAFIMVPHYNVAASAGGGSEVQSEQVVDHLAFKREWVSSIGLQHDNLALISAMGDSMEPTIGDGDLLLIDTRRKKSITDGIYVLRMDGGLIAKRLQLTLDGGLIVRSDNKIYQELIANKDQIQFIDIIGRVVWTGSRI